VLAFLETRVVFPSLDRLDSARVALLRALGPVARPFVRSRNLRVVVVALVSVVFALAASVLATGYLLLLGPLVFGAAHLFAEARVLLPAHRRTSRFLVAAVAAQIGFVFAGHAVVALPWMTLAAVIVLARGKWRLFAVLALVIAGVGTAIGPTTSRLGFLHAHNLVPLFVWLVARKRSWAVSFAVVGFVALALALLLSGAFDGFAIRTPLAERVFSLVRLTDAVAGGASGSFRKRLLVVFAFTQSFHYAAWLRLVPEEARERETPRGFRASVEALQHDVGRLPTVLALVVIVAIPLAALVLGAVRARSFYVTASELHASVEALLVVVALAAQRGERAFANR
jgi:hypothetical protein